MNEVYQSSDKEEFESLEDLQVPKITQNLQNKSDRQIELIAMINDLQKEVHQLKESKSIQ